MVGKIGTKATQITIINAVMTMEAYKRFLTRCISSEALATKAFAESAKANTGTSMKLQRIWIAR